MVADNVGILGIEAYFPKEYVSQASLEEYDGVGTGKYTIGLGQKNMAVCDNTEDIVSMSMTVLSNLMEKYNLKAEDIGRLEVGTESIVDKSKAVKTYLMDVLNEQGVYDVLGADTYNACYGGTNALFNAINWVESRSYNGKYAVVICGDIAVYEAGPARPTGGAGAIGLLIGPDAPITFDSCCMASYVENAYDFYKPNMLSEYPVVDGKLSNDCYIRALDYCYNKFGNRSEECHGAPFSAKTFDNFIFHSPYTKLVQKSFARVNYLDYKREKINSSDPVYSGINDVCKDIESSNLDEEYMKNRNVEKGIVAATTNDFNNAVKPGLLLNQECGNMYTGSAYASLCSVIYNNYKDTPAQSETAKKAGIFSYGSGLIASLFSVSMDATNSKNAASLHDMANKLNLSHRLDSREQISAEKFTERLTERETKYNQGIPKQNLENSTPKNMFPNTYYIKSVDTLGRKQYARTFSTGILKALKFCRR